MNNQIVINGASLVFKSEMVNTSNGPELRVQWRYEGYEDVSFSQECATAEQQMLWQLEKQDIVMVKIMGELNMPNPPMCQAAAYHYKNCPSDGHCWNKSLETIRDLMLAGF